MPSFSGTQPFFIILWASGLAALANFAVQFMLARTLGPAQFGAFSSALAILTLLASLAAFGGGSWWLRVFGEEGYAAQRWVKPSLQISVVSSCAVITFLLGWASFGPRTYPFGLESFLFLVYYQTDLILLRYLVNEEAVGFYGASVIFMAVVYLLPSILYQKFLLPNIHRWAYEESGQFKASIRKGCILLFVPGIFVMLIIWYSGEQVIQLVLGDEYYPSVTLLMLMSLAIPFRYLAVHLGSVLCTRDLIWNNVKITGFTAMLNVFLNFLLIPQYGGAGAAVATVVSYVFLAVLFTDAVRQKILGQLKDQWALTLSPARSQCNSR